MKPPRLLSWIMARLVPETERDALLGDLEEEYATRLRRDGRIEARRWYRQQTLGAVRLILSPASRFEPPPSRIFAMGDLIHEVRFALRQLRRRPLYAAVVVLTLAVGIGATSAVLSVANPVLFRPLPYPHPDRLMVLGEVDRAGTFSTTTGYLTFADLRRDIRAFEGAAAMSQWLPVLGGDQEPEQLSGQSVTSEFFTLLGVPMFLGRNFTPQEDAFDQNRVVILSHHLWRRRFGSDPGVVGRTLRFGAREYSVVGVLPASFESLLSPGSEIWRPLGYNDTLAWACRTCRHLRVVARLRPDVSVEQAQAEATTEAGRLAQDHPSEYAISGIRLEPLSENLVRSVRPALLLMLGAGLFVLLIACANVGNLVLARTTERAGELSVRQALGAGHWRLLHQLITESAMLCFAGAALGLLLARYGVTVLIALSPASLPRLSVIHLDWRVTLMILGATVCVSLLIGLIPGIMALRHPQTPGTVRAVTAGRRQRQLTAALVVAEVSLAFMLLFGAGLLTRSLGRVLAVNPGFDPANLLTVSLIASGPRYQTDSSVWQMEQQLVEAVSAVPGVERAGFSQQIPLSGDFDRYGVRAQDKPLANPEDAPSADRYAVWPGYIEAMGIPVVRGRSLTAADRGAAVPVVLINQSLARLVWPGEDPIGKRIQMESFTTPWRTIVGVVGDVKHTGLDEITAPQVYVPTTQWPWADNGITLVLRTKGKPSEAATAVRLAIKGVDPALAIGQVATVDDLVQVSTTDRRLVMRLFEAFGTVALILAVAGIYGLLSRRVAERERELGIRSALGATRRRIVELVVSDGGRLALLGLGIGLAGSLALAQLLQGLLFNIAPRDPSTLLAAALVLGGSALLACLVPAWRATRVDPVEALRSE